MGGSVIFLGIVGLCVLYPRAVAQWFVAAIVSFVAAYLTSGGDLAPFEMWFAVDYIFIQVLFSLFNNRRKS